jgi:chemotaxis protein methyltransferase CheR
MPSSAALRPQPRENLADDLDGSPERAREFEFSIQDFRALAAIAHAYAGIALSDGKQNLVYGRLTRRLRLLGLASFRDYRAYLQSPDGDSELEPFINAISTNLTRFFREPHHFDHLRQHVALPFAAKPDARLRLWSAGCSTGEEAYTLAAVLAREAPDIARRDARILATDIDTDVLSRAAAGEYPAAALDDAPPAYRAQFGVPEAAVAVRMPESLRGVIRFRRLNLMEPWPFTGLFDAVLCRNVMIYFDAPTKAALIDRFAAQLKPGGWLCIGHSESLQRAHPLLEPAGRTIYRRLP